MATEKNEKRSMISALFFVMIGFAALLGIYMCAKGLFQKEDMPRKMILNGGWDISVNEVETKDVNIVDFRFDDVKRGDVIKLKKDNIKSNVQATVLLLMIKNCAITVKQNDEAIYTYGSDLYEKGKLIGSGYHRINLHNLKEGASLEIDLVAAENNAFSSLDAPEIRDGRTISYELTEELFVPGVLSDFFVIFGASLIVISILLAISNTMDTMYIFKVFCIAVFSVFAGFWVFTSSNVAVFYTTDYSGKSFVEYLSLYLMPLTVLSYQIDSNIKGTVRDIRARTYILLWVVDALFVVYVIINQLTGRVNVVRFLAADHMLSVCLLLYITVTQIYDVVKKKSTNYVTVAGVLVLVLAGLFEVFRYNFSRYVLGKDLNYKTSFLFMAGLVFVWSLIIDYVRNAVMSVSDRARMEAVENMAYKDSLTGIYNRAAAEKRYRELDEEGTAYCIIELDLNGLKRINDTFGHDEGDEYIRDFAGLLFEVFSDYAMVTRTGGDEFTVIVDKKELLQSALIRRKLSELNLKILHLNAKHENWNLSSAYGYCFYNEEGVGMVSDAFKKADERMYEMKKEMKKETRKDTKKGSKKKK